MSYDLDALKALLPEYLHRVGAHIFRKTEDKLTAACPIHGGSKPNFHAVRKADGAWLWICRSGCGGAGGALPDLHASLNSLPHGSGQAITGAAEVVGLTPDDSPDRPYDDTLARRRREERRAREAKVKAQAVLTESIRQKRDDLLKPHLSEDWKENLWHSSQMSIPADTAEQARLMLGTLFNPDDLLWLGDTYESGKQEHAANFRPCCDWLTMSALPPRVAAGVFKLGAISRSAGSVKASPFVVIESDDLIGHRPTTEEEREFNKMLCTALFLFMRDCLKMNLRAVIDTGGKSLHGWFDRPTDEAMSKLAEIAEGLAIDTAVLIRCASNPLRLPGCIHPTTERPAVLYHLNLSNDSIQ